MLHSFSTNSAEPLRDKSMASTTANRDLLWYYLITSHPDEEAPPEELVRGRNKDRNVFDGD
jgi:hypothetical protein